METVATTKAPAAIGPYSQAKIVGNMVYTSGQIALDPETGAINGDSIVPQTEQVLKNLAAVLEAAGTDMTKVVKTTCFLKNISDFAEFNATYEKAFPNKPARSCVEVACLPKNSLVEVEVIAVIE